MRSASLRIGLAAGMLLWGGAFSVGFAQNTGNITAQANVVTPITVTPQINLDFGNVFPGVAKTVPRTAATAGRWRASGFGGAQVTLSFTLPTNLTSGANTLPISFGAGTAGRNTVLDAATATAFDPAAGATANLAAAPASELFVWIGGTVTPTVAQPAGLYTGTITLTVSYTGV